MGDLFLLSARQMARISPYFPLSHGVPRVDDRRVVSGIVYVIRNGLQRKDAPEGYGPPQGALQPLIRWSRLGVFDRIFAALAREGPRPERMMIDATRAADEDMAGPCSAKEWASIGAIRYRKIRVDSDFAAALVGESMMFLS